MRLRAQGIDDNDSGVGRLRQTCGLSDDDGGVGTGQGIYNTSEGLETMTEAAGLRQ